MPRRYYVPFDGVSIAAAQDLVELSPATDKPIRLLGWDISNVAGTADAGDAQEELLRIIVSRGAISTGNGSAVTPVTRDPNAQAAGFTAKVNSTTIGTNTNSTTLFTHGLNIRVPDVLFFPEEVQPQTTLSVGKLCVRLQTAPADAVLMSGTFFVEEL